MSPSSLPVITSSSSAASATVRASAPSIASPARSGTSGALEIRPRDGLMPKSPQTLAGMRMDPPPSLPWAAGASPDAAAGLRDRLLGLGGLIAGQVSGDREIGPDLVVQPVDSVKVVPGDLDR